jgi:hypothetical protein
MLFHVKDFMRNIFFLLLKIKSCGFVPLVNYIFKMLPICLIKIDNEMRPIRDNKGFCIECERGEKGLLIGFIGGSAQTQYSGYANNVEATNSKVIVDVFKKGQNAFNSGIPHNFIF